MTFTRALSVNETEIAQMVSTLHGIVRDELLPGQLPFVDDVQTATEQMQENLKMEAEMFGTEQQTARKENEDKDEESVEE